ncbi:TetR/AcrR family transcriptional regulator [Actinomadura rugatobispora]|uniref:TetR/AcrR family transcriptional regulator n=1 Tax=Actinomadura rugatobispora TaxID=1994 RepID=A0ABW0ZX08_9ACTN|nr:TetR/AcrR family transcriptional regulator [Actinomadura rugatobispora]
MTGRPSVRERSPVELIETAERLFAVHGIDGVSLRQIGSEAGHRNPAAVQYHFGSKAALIRAVLEHRVPAINARRLELLERLRGEGRQDDLRGLVEAMARPLLDLDPQAHHYVVFLARLMSHRSELRAAYTATLTDAISAALVAQGIKAALADLPEPIREHRFSMAMELMVHVIANRQVRTGDRRRDGLTEALFANDLIDGMVGLLTAPHTPAGRRRA